jgi:3-hydroxyacyl-CoA dehydrogenase
MHQREICARGFRREDGLWDIEGQLTDTKAYVVENAWRGRLEPGEALHGMALRLTIAEDFIIQRAEAAIDASPFALCGSVTPDFRALEGLKIGAGWMKEVQKRLGGVHGCTHLVELLPVLATAAFQAIRAGRNLRMRESPERPALLNSCHAYDQTKENAHFVWPGYFEAREAPLLAPVLAAPGEAAAALAHLAAGAALLKAPEAAPVQSAAVIGLGTMGSGIVVALLDAGLDVTAIEVTDTALSRGKAAIEAVYATQVKRGRLTEAARAARLARLTLTVGLDGAQGADIAIEAVPEIMALKQDVLRKLDGILQPGAILASNTSTLDVNELARAVSRPASVVGTHFFVPANITPLLEIVQSDATSPDVLARVQALAARLQKLPVVARVCYGFIGNRMFDQYLRQAQFLVEEGAWPHEVDEALEAFGMAIGPFRSLDLIGLDIPWGVWVERARHQPATRQPALWGQMVEAGWLGRKAGRGWYMHEAGGNGRTPNPDAYDMIGRFWEAKGGRIRSVSNHRPLPNVRIVARCVLALANEGARLLGEGIARSGVDVDLVSVKAYGFPVAKGGPLWFAQSLGFETLQGIFKAFADAPGGDAEFWAPAPLIAEGADLFTSRAPSAQK